MDARREADITNTGEPSNEADALFGSSTQMSEGTGRIGRLIFQLLRYSPSPYSRCAFGLAP